MRLLAMGIGNNIYRLIYNDIGIILWYLLILILLVVCQFTISIISSLQMNYINIIQLYNYIDV